jgi:hypothetical protein
LVDNGANINCSVLVLEVLEKFLVRINMLNS